MFTRRSELRREAPFVSRLLLNAGLVLLPMAPAMSPAAEPERKIEVSSQKNKDGQSTVTVAISGIPPEELGTEGMKALLGYLTGRKSLDGPVPGTTNGSKDGDSAAPMSRSLGDRDEREFDLELNIHWRRATDDPKGDSKHEAKKTGEPKGTAEPNAHSPKKEGGTLDSIKKMISGGPAASAAAEKPVETTKGAPRPNDAEVEGILRSLTNLQKQIAEQAKGAERVKGLAESAGKTKGTPESEREIRKVAEAAAELEKMARDLEKRSKEVEAALDRARAKMSNAGSGDASGPTEKAKKKPKKSKNRKKLSQPKSVDDPQ